MSKKSFLWAGSFERFKEIHSCPQSIIDDNGFGDNWFAKKFRDEYSSNYKSSWCELAKIDAPDDMMVICEQVLPIDKNGENCLSEISQIRVDFVLVGIKCDNGRDVRKFIFVEHKYFTKRASENVLWDIEKYENVIEYLKTKNWVSASKCSGFKNATFKNCDDKFWYFHQPVVACSLLEVEREKIQNNIKYISLADFKNTWLSNLNNHHFTNGVPCESVRDLSCNLASPDNR